VLRPLATLLADVAPGGAGSGGPTAATPILLGLAGAAIVVGVLFAIARAAGLQRREPPP